MDLFSRSRQELAFIAVALLLAYGIYQTAGVALDTDVPVVAVTSPSMEPTLHRGDMVVVRGQPFDSIEEGDIVVFDSGSPCIAVPIIHRVVNVTPQGLTTQGDRNPDQLVVCQGNGECSKTFNSCPVGTERIDIEQNITAEQVKGVVAFKVPLLGYVKLAPTCAYLRFTQGQVSSTLCP